MVVSATSRRVPPCCCGLVRVTEPAEEPLGKRIVTGDQAVVEVGPVFGQERLLAVRGDEHVQGDADRGDVKGDRSQVAAAVMVEDVMVKGTKKIARVADRGEDEPASLAELPPCLGDRFLIRVRDGRHQTRPSERQRVRGDEPVGLRHQAGQVVDLEVVPDALWVGATRLQPAITEGLRKRFDEVRAPAFGVCTNSTFSGGNRFATPATSGSTASRPSFPQGLSPMTIERSHRSADRLADPTTCDGNLAG